MDSDTLEKLIIKAQEYIGKTPSDKQCFNWTELHEKLETEMRGIYNKNKKE